MVDWRLRTVQMQFTTISVNPIVAQTTETYIYRKEGCAKLLLTHPLLSFYPSAYKSPQEKLILCGTEFLHVDCMLHL